MSRWLMFTAACLMFGRLFVAPEPITWSAIYKDFAHLFMGGFFIDCVRDHDAAKSSLKWTLFAMLCAWEITIAIFSRSF